ncbi:MAG TPA: hypothetical protein VHB79_03650 [Polyangiaceae bacterium]|nr:hypothetical protein [Polyangiaceae bacterium]
MSTAEGVGIYFMFIALCCIAGYLFGRRAVLEICSSGAKIQVEARGMSHEALVEFIDTLERAKLSAFR